MIREVRTTAFWQAVCCLAGSWSKTFLSWSLRIKDSEKNEWIREGNIKSSRQNGIILLGVGGERLYVFFSVFFVCHVNLGHTTTTTTSRSHISVKAFLVFGHPYPTMALSAADLQVVIKSAIYYMLSDSTSNI